MIHRNDPKIMALKYPGKCRKCGSKIKSGDKIVYWPLSPKGEKVECWACSEGDYLAFESSKFDEEVLMPAAGYNFGIDKK